MTIRTCLNDNGICSYNGALDTWPVLHSGDDIRVSSVSCILLSHNGSDHGNVLCSNRDDLGAEAVEHSDQDLGEEEAVEQSDEGRGDDQDRRDVQILEKLLTQTLLLK